MWTDFQFQNSLPIDSWENSLYTYYKDFYLTCNVATNTTLTGTKSDTKPKMLPNFHVERDD